jgi:D-serine dehydratase
MNLPNAAQPALHPDARTRYDASAVTALAEECLPPGTKGAPLAGEGMTLGAFAASGLHALDGGLPMPLLLLRERALADNLAAMADFCQRSGVLLAPHGKTTMAPQILARQIDAGAWAITAATPSHLRVYRRFAIQRILLANQLVEEGVVRWLCEELARDDDFELICLVDSVAGVRRLDAQLARSACPRPLGVLLEVGYGGGRAGVRDLAVARSVADAANAAAHLDLLGVECYEGMLDGGDIDSTIGLVDRHLEQVAEVVEDLLDAGRLPAAPLLSGGGSAYFDRVLLGLAHLPGWLILRAGCYVVQDGGFYARTSPLAGRAEGRPLLRNALELWSAVLSRPEPERVIAGFGKRDAPYDMGLPVPTHARTPGDGDRRLPETELLALNDQHAHVRVPAAAELGPGDLLSCSVSHPCGAFDRWRVVPVVDDEDQIVDAVLTFL